MVDWLDNPYVMFHHTLRRDVDKILRNGILSRKKLNKKRDFISPIYCASLQPTDEISLFSAGGDYRDFASRLGLTKGVLRSLNELDFEVLLASHDVEFTGRRRDDGYKSAYSTLSYVLEELHPFDSMLKDEPAFRAGNTVIIVVSPEQERRLFPHSNMDVFEVCVKTCIEPSRIIDVVDYEKIKKLPTSPV